MSDVTGRNLNDLPMIHVSSVIDNIPYLSYVDPEVNVPSKVNFNYFKIEDFQDSIEIKNLSKFFSILNCNIRSLRANFDIFFLYVI
jgi:hypothetical protein